MANTYKHGAYGELSSSIAKNATQAGTVAVYVGTAPVHLVQGYAEKEVVNLPVKINDFTDAQKKIGFSEDWETFTLCEAIAAHFDNGLQEIGPIYVINVLDPDIHKKGTATNKSVTFTNGVAEIKTDTAILDTVTISNYTKDTDFTVDYNFTTGTLIINAVNPAITGTQTVAYYEIDTTNISSTTVIGGTTSAGVRTGFDAINLLYDRENQVANLIGAPGWSDIPAVYAKMINAATKINGHWDAFVFADLPVDNNGTAVDTITKAKTFRTSNGYDSERSEIFWPQWKDVRTGRIYHLATLGIVAALITDFEHDSVPFESCSNKEIPSGKQYFGDGATNQGHDQSTATNDLNAYGISTAVFWGGRCVLWGGHTAKYAYGKDMDVRGIDTQYMRMLFHCTNGFQRRQSMTVDEPFNRQLKDSILNDEQEILDSYIAQGALLDGSRIFFTEAENSTTDMINGDFVFNIPVTVTPRAKSLTGKVAYTDAGLTSLYGEEE